MQVHAGGPSVGGWVEIALKPASKTLRHHGVFIRSKGLEYVIADSAFKHMQVDARARWLDTGEHHRGLALRTSGALKCNRWNGGRQALRSGHEASLEQAGAATLSVTGNAWGGGGVIVRLCASRDLKRELIRGYLEGRHQAGTSGPPVHA
jgi:hypothetical protein